MKKILSNIKSHYKLILVTLIAGLAIGWIVKPSHNGATTHQHEHAVEEATVWTCSMHPQIKQDKPGLCPICAMDLIPLKSMQGSDDADPNEIGMSEAAIKLADIQTMMVMRKKAQRETYLQGKIEADERNIAQLTARFGGRIEELFVNFTGQEVKKGQPLASIYAPELVSAQRELIEAAAFKETNPGLYKAAKAKLQSWDLTAKQISDIEKAREPIINFKILSPVSGTVTTRNIAQGDYVKEGTNMFQIFNLDKVWVLLDAYETDLPWIKKGDEINFGVKAIPGETYSSKVSFIDPVLNAQTRIAKVRAEVNNQQGLLKPGMFVSATLQSDLPAKEDLIVPKSAVLWTGKRAVVYVKVKERDIPTFLYREIVTGADTGDSYVVAKGLQEGEEIAVNGVFKIDAAAQLEGKSSIMNTSMGDQHHMNMTSESFQVAGNCNMCKKKIETAALSVNGVHSAQWDKLTKTFKVSFNKDQTTLIAIHKAIAASGYDTQLEKAAQTSYDDLHSCCKYDRNNFGLTNEKTESFSFNVMGNCDMCKTRIEKAALSVDGVYEASWDKNTKRIEIKANTDLNLTNVHKAIATAGHDTDKETAPDDIYDKLPGCCLYDRHKK